MFKIDPERNRLVISKLAKEFNDSVLKSELLADMFCIHIRKESLQEVLQFLRDDPELNYNFLTTLCGMHYPETQQLGIVYHLHNFVNDHRLRIKTYTPVDDPTFPTATKIWPSANWMERETFDFYGIHFEGHPNLVRILNVDEMEGFPLRKDFPLEDQTREDKDDKMFGR